MDHFEMLASLRPGMPETAYSIPDRPEPVIEGTAYDTDGRWPPRKRYTTIGIGTVYVDHRSFIESVGFGKGFPQTTRVAGLSIGMSWSDALDLYPALRLNADQCGTQSYDGAMTADASNSASTSWTAISSVSVYRGSAWRRISPNMPPSSNRSGARSRPSAMPRLIARTSGARSPIRRRCFASGPSIAVHGMNRRRGTSPIPNG
jgi:hypothetical protein